MTRVAIVLVLLLGVARAGDNVHHDLVVRLSPADHAIAILDKITGVSGNQRFRLHAGLTVTSTDEAFTVELLGTVDALEELLDDEGAADARQKAIGTMALCIGGMVMARAVPDTQLSDEILLAARNFAGGVKHRRGR